MSVCVVQENPQGTQENYDRIIQQLKIDDGEVPEGLLCHFAGPSEDGGWCIVTEWESREQFETFANEKLRPLLGQMGLQQPPVQPKVFEVYREFFVDEYEEETALAA